MTGPKVETKDFAIHAQARATGGRLTIEVGRARRGRSCAATPAAHRGRTWGEGEVAHNAAFAFHRAIERPGRYLICGWVQDPSGTARARRVVHVRRARFRFDWMRLSRRRTRVSGSFVASVRYRAEIPATVYVASDGVRRCGQSARELSRRARRLSLGFATREAEGTGTARVEIRPLRVGT